MPGALIHLYTERDMRFASHSKSELHVSRLNGATGFMASVPHISGDVLEHAQTEQQILWQGKYAAIEAPSRCEPPPHREAPSQETPCFQIPVNLHLLANPCLSFNSTH